jgi:starvation-inducible DNA-binding protein
MKELLKKLNREVANFGVLEIKFRNYHWFAKGMTFHQMHQLFEKLGDEAAGHLDALAERILMLEGRPFATMKECLANVTITEANGNETVMEMINQTIYDFTAVEGEIGEAAKTAQTIGDEVTASLLQNIQSSLQKHLWMLKTLEK